MSDLTALDLSSAGMKAQRIRMQVVAENLANQHTTGPDGPYQRKEVVFESQPVTSFQNELDGAMANGNSENVSQSVEVKEIRADGSEPIKVFDPSHPFAIKSGPDKGFVMYPNISIFREMADMVEASRSYEANLAANKTTKDMINSAIDLLRR